jgi:hypothetical protein
LIVIDRAREILGEIATGASPSQVDAPTILKTIALVSSFGFLFVTGGVVGLTGIIAASHAHDYLPGPILVGIAGYSAIVMICWHLLKLIGALRTTESKHHGPPSPHTAPAAVPGSTNRTLAEGSPAYHSVTEQTTRQFDAQRRADQ